MAAGFRWLANGMASRPPDTINKLHCLHNPGSYKSQRTDLLHHQIRYVLFSTHPTATHSLVGSFSCPLVHSLPYCPSVSFAAPLPAPAFPNVAHDSTTLPNSLTDPLLSYLTNFTTSLLTFACGRDLYSPLQSCADCQRAYRKWLCTISFPRCAEFATTTTTTGNAQQVFPALIPQPSGTTPRNPNLANASYSYVQLLPCIETCTATDRACPNFLGFQCPVVAFNANDSYGVGYIDNGKPGIEGDGFTGTAQDRWGNVYCNGS